jgi:hypothetical protein
VLALLFPGGIEGGDCLEIFEGRFVASAKEACNLIRPLKPLPYLL